jgi:hypothetical protein
LINEKNNAFTLYHNSKILQQKFVVKCPKNREISDGKTNFVPSDKYCFLLNTAWDDNVATGHESTYIMFQNLIHL